MLSTMIVFSILMLGVMSYYNKTQLAEKNSDAVINLLDYLQSETILATKMKSGYTQIFDIPEKINNENYIIVTTTNSITITHNSKSYSAIIPEIDGTFQIPNNVIKKVGEEVRLN